MRERKVFALVLALMFLAFVGFNLVSIYFFGVPLSPVVLTGKAVTETTGIVKIFIDEQANHITIHFPENVSYEFAKGDPYLMQLNVSADFAVDAWEYSLYDVRHSLFVQAPISFTPNVSTFNAVRWQNNLTVYAHEAGGVWTTETVFFFVDVNGSAPLLGEINDSFYICETQEADYDFNATDIDEDALVGDVSPRNPFFVSDLGMLGYNMSLFSLRSLSLQKEDIGFHKLTVSVDDLVDGVDEELVNVTVIEINNAPSVAEIGAQTVWLTGEDSVFEYQVNADDIEDDAYGEGNLDFNISFLGEGDLFGINSTGFMNYTPAVEDLDVHNITVCVEDNALNSVHENFSICAADGLSSNSWSVCDNFLLTVTAENRAPYIVNYLPVSNFSVYGTVVSIFNVTVADPDGGAPDIDWYVDGVLQEHNEGITFDNFSYAFGCDVSGRHEIMIFTTDGELNDSHVWGLDVFKTDCSKPAGGGGGGGGGGLGLCSEDWACNSWGLCQNVKRSYDSGALSSEENAFFEEVCAQNGYDDVYCGFQITNCFDLNNCNNSVVVTPKPVEMRACYFTEDPSCVDGIKNCHDGDCELLVDCGGPCDPCPTCSDGKQNQGEEDVDCGGPCPYSCEEESPSRALTSLLILLLIILLILIIYTVYKVFRIIRYRFFLLGAKEREKEESEKRQV